ncbi:MAG: helix-turn-helix transcriptional regulator [Labilithrix sp.]|nr:helix-turn-helix transcriptional regulator [Labilithrix sp.]
MRPSRGERRPGRAGEFDLDGFVTAIDAARRALDLSWSAVAARTGVSASTLTRMAQGRSPEIGALAALAAWSGTSLDAFVRPTRPASHETAGPSAIARVASELQRAPELGRTEALAIAEIVAVAYERLRRP